VGLTPVSVEEMVDQTNANGDVMISLDSHVSLSPTMLRDAFLFGFLVSESIGYAALLIFANEFNLPTHRQSATATFPLDDSHFAPPTSQSNDSVVDASEFSVRRQQHSNCSSLENGEVAKMFGSLFKIAVALFSSASPNPITLCRLFFVAGNLWVMVLDIVAIFF
jgi:hypothetical protein